MNCEQLITCKKPVSNHPCSYDNTVAEETKLSPVKLCTVLFNNQSKLINFSL